MILRKESKRKAERKDFYAFIGCQKRKKNKTSQQQKFIY